MKCLKNIERMATLTKKDLRKAIKNFFIVILLMFNIYCIVVRFMYPELTETQLFLKVFGLD